MRYHLLDGHFAGRQGEWPEEASEIFIDEPISENTARRHWYRFVSRQGDNNLFEAVSVEEIRNPGGLADLMGRTSAKDELARRLADARARDIEMARDWLVEKWQATEHVCPHCGNQEWELGTPFTFATSIGESTPHFSAMCTNCFYTAFVNAVRAGLVSEDD
jgi:predicted nucleic-acid-binding Zn-ribbon protein